MTSPICTYTDPTTVEHPAIGDELITVENPDYVPATEGYYETVANPDYVPATEGYYETVANPDYVPEVPETSEVVHHEAVMATQWKYVKNGGKGEVWLDYYQHGKIKIGGHWYQATQHTREVTVTEAWDETIITPGTPAVGDEFIEVWHEGSPAVGEEFIEVWHEGTPAVGEETIEVSNPDYVAAWTEEVPGSWECETQGLPTPSLPQPLPCEGVYGPGSVFGDDCWLKLPPADLETVCAEDVTWWECYLLDSENVAEPQEVVSVVATMAQPAAVPAGEPTLAVTGSGDFFGAALLGAVVIAAGAALAFRGARKSARTQA